MSRLGGGRPQDGQPDARRLEPARDEARSRQARDDDQVRAAGNRDAGVRQVRVHRRPLLRHEAGGSQGADGRSARNLPAA